MQPYSPGKPVEELRRELGLERIAKLASNENPLGPSPKAVTAMQAVAGEMHLYPDGAAFALKQALSSHFGVPVENIAVGNGSDELIGLLGLVLLESPTDEVVVGDPSFVRYDSAAQLAPSVLKKVPLDAGMRHDLPAMARACTENTRMVFIANPNNPTGTYVSLSEVSAFLNDLPPQAILVMDEAYFEYACSEPGYPDGRQMLLDGHPVVALRTFSKGYGLAGLRLGYGFAHADLVDGINRARGSFNVSRIAQAAGIAALSDVEFLQRTISTNRLSLKRLFEGLTAMGFHPVPSAANFLFVDMGQPALPIFQNLLKKGLIVRPGHIFGTPNHLRISVGTLEETEWLLAELAGCLQPA